MMPRGLGRLVLDPWALTPPLLDILQGLEHGARDLVEVVMSLQTHMFARSRFAPTRSHPTIRWKAPRTPDAPPSAARATYIIRRRRCSAGLREVDLEWGGDGPALAGIRDCGVHLRTGVIEGAIATSSPPGAARPCLGTALRHSTLGRHGPSELLSCVSTALPKTFTPQTRLKPGIIHRRTGVNWGFHGVFPRVEHVKTTEL